MQRPSRKKPLSTGSRVITALYNLGDSLGNYLILPIKTKTIRRYLPVAVLSAAVYLGGCVTNQPTCVAGVLRDGECGPVRSGLVNLTPDQEAEKVLGATTYSRFQLVDEKLVGAPWPNVLAAYSLKENRFLWKTDFDSEVAGPVSVMGTQAFVSLRDGTVAKVDTEQGKVLWESATGRFSNRRMVLSGKRLFIQSVDDQIFALDSDSGKKQWVFEAGGTPAITVRHAAAPVLLKNQLIMGASSGEIIALDLSNGSVVQRYFPKKGAYRFHDVVGDLAYEGGDLLFSRYDGSVGKLRLGDRDKVVWEKDLGSVSTSVYRKGVYYIGTASGRVLALSSADGEVLWEISTAETVLEIVPQSRALFVVGSNGQIIALSAADGRFQWVDQLAAEINPGSLVYGRSVYFTTGLNVLYGFRI